MSWVVAAVDSPMMNMMNMDAPVRIFFNLTVDEDRLGPNWILVKISDLGLWKCLVRRPPGDADECDEPGRTSM